MPQIFQWVPFLWAKHHGAASNSCYRVNRPCHILRHLRFASTESAPTSNHGGSLGEFAKNSRLVREEAQDALLDYFHCTRGIQILDAENMSKNTPKFFDKLLNKVEAGDAKVGRLLARFLRYHPVNEFEPFFESIGLKPSEYSHFLPQKLIFLNDDALLLGNYHVLCNYGIPRNRIGKIYKEGREIFQYDYGVLLAKLQSFENLGLKHSLVAKIVASDPRLLVGEMNLEFVKLLEKIRTAGIEYDWLEENLSVDSSYDWKRMLELMHSLRKLGLSEKQLWQILTLHPDILLESSGHIAFRMLGSLLKFGSTPSVVSNVFLEFPQIPVAKFANNLLHCYEFLFEINMEARDIGQIVCSHATVMGSCRLKKVVSVLSQLNCGYARLCQLVKNDPPVLRKWARGLKLVHPQTQKRVVKVRMIKIKFLSSLGFMEGSQEMERALKKLRGRAAELQERFDCLVEMGLGREDVIRMIKLHPEILNQKAAIIRQKVDFFVKKMGYSVSELVGYPKPISYTIERVKFRLLMYEWLKGEGAVRAGLSLSTLLSISDQNFVRVYVNSHPRGDEYWKWLKRTANSDRLDNEL